MSVAWMAALKAGPTAVSMVGRLDLSGCLLVEMMADLLAGLLAVLLVLLRAETTAGWMEVMTVDLSGKLTVVELALTTAVR
jgi:hypothetical protein